MNKIKDTDFYNEASDNYSRIRYPKIANSYSQFFFIKRLKLVKDLLNKHIKNNSDLLEIGCADGIVIGDLYKTFQNKFIKLVGIDISLKMIEAAKALYQNTTIIFKLREEESQDTPYDLIIEVGVINYADTQEEINYISSKLKPEGLAIISYAGNDSLWNKLKKGNKGFNNFLSYKEFEREVRTKFIIKDYKCVGLFIPLIWKIPTLGRIIQYISDRLFNNLIPNLYHEKIYLIEKLNSNPSTSN